MPPLQLQLMIIVLAVSWFNLLAPSAANAKSKPLWEMGLTAGGAWVPDYPAADEHHAIGLVLPYAIYRGSIFRAGEDGIARGRLFRSPQYEFDLSLSASFPSDSDQNEARRGMPDLDLLLEVGPRLKIKLVNLTDTSNLELELPLRAVISVDLSQIRYRGLVFNPSLVYTHTDLLKTDTVFTVSLGPVFATNRSMDYFYEVEPRFATPTRAAFKAKAGYLGSELTFFARLPLSKRVDIFGAVQVGYYAGATNTASPLFRDEVNVSLGLGLIWSIFQSQEQVANER